MKFLLTLISLFVLLCNNCNAQHYKMHPSIPVDSSYTIQNQFKKYKKDYPYITPISTGDTSKLTIINDIVYCNYGERELHLDIAYLKSKKKEKLPVVILVHGGGWRSGDKSMQTPMACELARNGFITINIEYRLSMEALYPEGLKDIKTAIRWVKNNTKNHPIDSSRIALLGCSSGGQMVSLLGSINGYFEKYEPEIFKNISDRVDAVIDIDGVLAFIHPESGEGKDKPGKPSASTLWFNSTIEQDSLVRYEASALTHVNKNTAKFLFVCSSIPRYHGGRDDMIKKMNNYKIYSEVFTIPDTPHTFWLFNPWFDSISRTIVKFLKYNL
ncbi:MAG: alpha/beta hydrolase [Marinilabiliaceae bacterium]|nr:alpha/beta hydrolase [Marinilabiliaceae bacterium]